LVKDYSHGERIIFSGETESEVASLDIELVAGSAMSLKATACWKQSDIRGARSSMLAMDEEQFEQAMGLTYSAKASSGRLPGRE
jgi:hypothetical protein